jgi:leader peptidase (prepilin peptidase)/N-methyltransferase
MRYPLTELACAVGAVLAAQHLGFTLTALAVMGLWWCVVAIIITDLEHYIILDEVQLAIIGFGVLYHYVLGHDLIDAFSIGLLGLAIGLSLKYGFLYLRNKDGLGLGDVKLLFGAGIWLASGTSFVPFLFFAGLLGVVFGCIWRVLGFGNIFPFGPALEVSLLACVLWPDSMAYFWQFYSWIGIA